MLVEILSIELQNIYKYFRVVVSSCFGPFLGLGRDNYPDLIKVEFWSSVCFQFGHHNDIQYHFYCPSLYVL